MRRLNAILAIAALAATAVIGSGMGLSQTVDTADSIAIAADSTTVPDSLPLQPQSVALTEQDLIDVADSLGIDVPAIHAVIDIEAGPKHVGFWAPGKPVINFSLSQFRKAARRHGISIDKYQRQYPELFASPNARKYGSQQAGAQARLDAALSIDSVAAIESTFWGMFQIGGFNWRKCGCQTPAEFMQRMCLSEREQLNLFAGFLQNTGLDKPLQRHDWSVFARGYNGASYARRGYHTRLKRAYDKYAAQP